MNKYIGKFWKTTEDERMWHQHFVNIVYARLRSPLSSLYQCKDLQLEYHMSHLDLEKKNVTLSAKHIFSILHQQNWPNISIYVLISDKNISEILCAAIEARALINISLNISNELWYVLPPVICRVGVTYGEMIEYLLTLKIINILLCSKKRIHHSQTRQVYNWVCQV